MVLIKRLVEEAGEATNVTCDVPFNTPSLEPSTKVVPLSSEYAVIKLGLVVVAADDIATVIDFVVVSKTNMMSLYLEVNQENANGTTVLPPPLLTASAG